MAALHMLSGICVRLREEDATHQSLCLHTRKTFARIQQFAYGGKNDTDQTCVRAWKCAKLRCIFSLALLNINFSLSAMPSERTQMLGGRACKQIGKLSVRRNLVVLCERETNGVANCNFRFLGPSRSITWKWFRRRKKINCDTRQGSGRRPSLSRKTSFPSSAERKVAFILLKR
jgi:hypothetical protein